MKLYHDLAILILRVSLGAGMLFSHGLSKLTGFSSMSGSFPDPLGLGSPVSLGLAVFAEVFCALFVALGLLTRWVTIPLMVTMLVAIFIIHATDPWKSKELAFLYLAGYVAIWLLGPGRFSMDKIWKK